MRSAAGRFPAAQTFKCLEYTSRMHDVFISYSSKDKVAADAVCHALEESGMRCWIAPRDVVAGTDWNESIIRAIGECKVLVLLLSQNSSSARQVHQEVIFAVQENRSVVPLRLEDISPAGALKLQLSGTHWLDAFPPPLDRHLQELCRTLRVLLDAQGMGASKVGAQSADAKVSHPPTKGRMAYWILGALAACLLLWTSRTLIAPHGEQAIIRPRSAAAAPPSIASSAPTPAIAKPISLAPAHEDGHLTAQSKRRDRAHPVPPPPATSSTATAGQPSLAPGVPIQYTFEAFTGDGTLCKNGTITRNTPTTWIHLEPEGTGCTLGNRKFLYLDLGSDSGSYWVYDINRNMTFRLPKQGGALVWTPGRIAPEPEDRRSWSSVYQVTPGPPVASSAAAAGQPSSGPGAPIQYTFEAFTGNGTLCKNGTITRNTPTTWIQHLEPEGTDCTLGNRKFFYAELGSDTNSYWVYDINRNMTFRLPKQGGPLVWTSGRVSPEPEDRRSWSSVYQVNRAR
jgi:hypothetical protein